jgi:hypothetical protein
LKVATRYVWRVEGSSGEWQSGDEESFEVSAEPESAEARERFESLNVCRVAALSALSDESGLATEGIATPLEEIGVDPALATGRWSLAVGDPVELLAELEPEAYFEGRVELWRSARQADPVAAAGFLVAVLGSPLERESTAAAVALWNLLTGRRRPRWARQRFSPLPMDRELGEVGLREWAPDVWRRRFAGFAEELVGVDPPLRRQRLLALTRSRILQALRSPDPIVAALAATTQLESGSVADRPPGEPGEGGVAGKHAKSTMIHGTWGWKGDWWRPGGGFHEYVRADLRPDLYSGGGRFSWSGFYRKGHRRRAAADFCEWQRDMAPEGLHSLFGHSYGGEVAARAIVSGTPVAQLVLLVAALDCGVKVIDVRLWFDPVLGLAWTRQRLPAHPSLTTILLDRRTLNHSSTHHERVWVAEKIASRLGI